MTGIHCCRVVFIVMWAKITYKNFILQVCRIFVSLELLVLGGDLMSCPNLGAKFRSQCL